MVRWHRTRRTNPGDQAGRPQWYTGTKIEAQFRQSRPDWAVVPQKKNNERRFYYMMS